VSRETADSTTFTFTNVPNANLDHPNPFDDSGTMGRTTNQITSTTAIGAGIYLIDQIALTNWLKVIGGIRWDRFEAEFRGFTRPTGVLQEFERTDYMWSPRASVVVQPTSWQTYYFSYGTSFNPSAEALTLALNNADTRPEKNVSYELGAKLDLLKNMLGVRGALFRTEKTNARTIDPATGIMVLDGEQRVDGFELEAVGRPLSGWNIFVNYTYLDSLVTRSKDVVAGVAVQGKRIPNVPENSAGLWTTWALTPRWQGGGGGTPRDLTPRWGGGGGPAFMPNRPANTPGPIGGRGHVLGALTAAYRPT